MEALEFVLNKKQKCVQWLTAFSGDIPRDIREAGYPRRYLERMQSSTSPGISPVISLNMSLPVLFPGTSREISAGYKKSPLYYAKTTFHIFKLLFTNVDLDKSRGHAKVEVRGNTQRGTREQNTSYPLEDMFGRTAFSGDISRWFFSHEHNFGPAFLFVIVPVCRNIIFTFSAQNFAELPSQFQSAHTTVCFVLVIHLCHW